MDVISKMATFNASSTGYNSGRAVFSGLSVVSYARTIYINLGGSQQKSWSISANASPSSSYTAYFSNLNPNTNYTANCTVYRNSDWTVVYSNSSSFRTEEKPLPKLTSPTLNTGATIKTNTSIQITMYTVTEAERYYARINGGTIYSGTGRTFNFTGLNPNTQYLIEIKCSATGYLDSNWVGYRATTLSISSWEWWYPKTKDSSFNLTADEWLAFCSKINEIRVANGLNEYGFSISPTYIAKDKPYYAWIYNQAKIAIDGLNTGYTLLTATSGDMVKANEHFNNLKNALNSAI